MSKKPVSLEMQMRGQSVPAETTAENAQPAAVTNANPQEKATVYMPRPAMKCLKQMALDQDKRINDLLQEGLDLVFAKYGQPSIKDYAQR